MFFNFNKKQSGLVIISAIFLFIVFLWWLGGQTNNINIDKNNNNNQNLTPEAPEEILRKEEVLISLFENSIQLKKTKKTDSLSFATRPFSKEDLNIKQTQAVSFYQEYAEHLAKILNPLTTFELSPAEVIIAVIEQEDFSKIEYIENRLKTNIDIINQLSEIEVPTATTQLHLSLINSLIYLNQPLYDMTQLKSDPIKALTGARKYQQKILTVFQTTNDFNQFFNDQQIEIKNVDKETL